MNSFAPRIGDVLVMQGALSRQRLEDIASKARGRLGDYLRAYGLVDGRSLAQALASHHALPQVDLIKNPPAENLFNPSCREVYIAHGFVPYKLQYGVLTIATSNPSEQLREFARTHYACAIELVVTTPRDLSHYFATRAATASTRHARLSLRRRYRHLVADRIMLAHQWRGLALVGVALAAIALAAPRSGWEFLLIACNVFYVATLIIKLEFYRQGAAAHRAQRKQVEALKRAASRLDDYTLPVYSILVPMYQESPAVMQRLITNLNALDYPKEKLDIKLICEADDLTTIADLKALRPPATMEIILVPPSHPRTKPKACNLALQHVRGEYVVIYDAEDAPAPDQLRRAYAMFQEGPENLACLQAPLNYYNRDENLLTQLFSIEYSALFNILLPGLERMKVPIPLGGTSNHLSTEALRNVGGWDAFNVTEDADLGVRLHYFGYATATLPSLTLEESPITIRAWMKQRTRWVKGYIQTWLVYTRDPRELKRRLGTLGYYGFQFFIGAPALTFLLAPVFWAVFIISLTGQFGGALSQPVQILCAISFVGGMLGHWLFARKVMQIEGWEYMRRAFLVYPLYWLLHSLAAARALWQLAFHPHYWDKTRHGLSKMLQTT